MIATAWHEDEDEDEHGDWHEDAMASPGTIQGLAGVYPWDTLGTPWGTCVMPCRDVCVNCFIHSVVLHV